MGHPEHPYMIQLESSTACDASCLFCHRPKMKRPGGTMSRWVFEKILHDAKELNISEIVIFLCGEPFLFPDVFKWLQRLREERCTTAIFTNAAHLDAEKARMLVGYSDVVHHVVFSLAGIDSESYERIMGLSFERVMENVEYFLDVNNREIRTVAHMPCFSQTTSFVDAWREYWVGKMDEVSPTPMFNYAGLVHDPLERTENEQQKKFYCDRLNHLMILWDGRVVLCCWDAEGQVVLGDVKIQSLRQVFYGDIAKRYRKLHSEGRFSELPLCTSCNSNILCLPDIGRVKKERGLV